MPRLQQKAPSKKAPRAARREDLSVAAALPFVDEEKAFEMPRIVSLEEKRSLVRESAMRRADQTAPNRFAIYAGVAASCLVIMTGWWLTVGSTIRMQLHGDPDAFTQILKQNVQQYEQNSKTSGTDLQTGKQILLKSLDDIQREQAMKQAAAAELNAVRPSTSTGSIR